MAGPSESIQERAGVDLGSSIFPPWLLRIYGVIGFTYLTWFGAQIAIPLPPDGVPMTFQTLFVVLAALCIGPRLGMASMGLYVIVGILGAGVFAEGKAGPEVLLGQTGGYLIGWIVCQPVITSIVRRRDGSIRGWGAMIIAVLSGHLVIFAIGVPWLAAVRDYSLFRAMQGGFFPFIPGMILKTVLAVLIGKWAAPRASEKFW